MPGVRIIRDDIVALTSLFSKGKYKENNICEWCEPQQNSREFKEEETGTNKEGDKNYHFKRLFLRKQYLSWGLTIELKLVRLGNEGVGTVLQAEGRTFFRFHLE